jgi:hypothetical protein
LGELEDFGKAAIGMTYAGKMNKQVLQGKKYGDMVETEDELELYTLFLRR